jgi:hypothetical protein
MVVGGIEEEEEKEKEKYGENDKEEEWEGRNLFRCVPQFFRNFIGLE